VMTATAARIFGFHVGQVVPMGFYTDAQESQRAFGTPRVPPRLRVDIKLVGIAVFDNAVVQDDIDRAYGFVMLTPALTREVVAMAPSAGAPVGYELQLDHGAGDVPGVEQEVIHLLPPGATSEFHVTARVVSEVELALRPESVALGGFGAIAALVCLVLGAQAVSRQLRGADEDRRVMRALGAGPAATVSDGLIGALGAVVLGSLVAVGVAVGLSPLSPLGPVRPVYPDRGTTFDWTVLGLGLAVLVGVLGAGAVAFCYRGAPHRLVRSQRLTARSTLPRGAASITTSPRSMTRRCLSCSPGHAPRRCPLRSCRATAWRPTTR